MLRPTGQSREGFGCRPTSLSRQSGSRAVKTRQRSISSGGQASRVPPVPGRTSRMPAFFSALTVLRITTGLHPVERAIQSLVTFPSPPYS